MERGYRLVARHCERLAPVLARIGDKLTVLLVILPGERVVETVIEKAQRPYDEADAA